MFWGGRCYRTLNKTSVSLSVSAIADKWAAVSSRLQMENMLWAVVSGRPRHGDPESLQSPEVLKFNWGPVQTWCWSVSRVIWSQEEEEKYMKKKKKKKKNQQWEWSTRCVTSCGSVWRKRPADVSSSCLWTRRFQQHSPQHHQTPLTNQSI